MNTKSVTRHSIRQTIRSRRKALSPQQQKLAAEQLTQILTANKNILNAETIAIYLSVDGELNTDLFIHWCWQQNKKVYIPVLHPFTAGHLLFLRYDKTTPMKKNIYGILEPVLDVRMIKATHSIDVIFTPLVAFDSTGSRMGMGGGFYDRTLANWFEQYKKGMMNKPYPIGLAHDCQNVSHVPTDTWDIPLPEIITPTQHFIFSI